MRRVALIFLVLLFSVCAGATLAFAQPLDRGELLGVFPQAPDSNAPVDRGAFGAMLARAASVPAASGQVYRAKDVDPASWYAPALAALEERGIMAGYPDGTLRPGQPVTGAEAAVMVARALGLFGTAGQPEAGPLRPDHWASSLYNWLVNQGLVSARSDPEGKLTVGEAADFLARVFGSDPRALDIVEKSGRAQADVKAVRLKSNIDMIMRPRAGMAGQVPVLSGSGQMSTELVFPATMHQVARWRFGDTGDSAAKDKQGLPELEVEQYLVGGKMYMKMSDPATGKAEWIKSAVPDLEAFMKESLEASKIGGGRIPEELKPYFHYQLLGTAEKDGRRVLEIGYYGRIDDLTAFLQLAQSLRGTLGGPEFERALNEAGKLVRSISYWGRDCIGADDYLLHEGALKVVLSFAERFQGEAMPVELIEMRMRVEECAYGEQIKIELPPEALQAREMPQP
ncbi:MAG: S-layer homology domain-containing protein [Desulfotomaculales bacterium]